MIWWQVILLLFAGAVIGAIITAIGLFAYFLKTMSDTRGYEEHI